MFPYEASDPFVGFITFAYGLAFFVLAVGVWLHRRTLGETALGKGLTFLSFYALFHGLSEWGEVFIPIQARVLSHQAVHLLQALHVITLSISFWFLLLYGVVLVGAARGRLWQWLALPATAILALIVIQSVRLLVSDSSLVHFWGLAELEAWSRHLLAIPATFIAGWGVALQRVPAGAGTDARRTNPYAAVMAAMFFAYAVVGGWIVPQCPVLPGSLLNASIVYEGLGIHVQVLRAIYGFGLTAAVFRLLKELDLQRHRRLQQAEDRAAILMERERIARDLHDGVIQTLYGVSLQLEGALRALEREGHGVEPQVRGAIRVLHETMQDIRSFVLHLRRVNPDQSDLRATLQTLVEEFRTNCLIEPQLLLPGAGVEEGLPQGAITQIYYIVRELLTNVAKHSRAAHVQVELRPRGNELVLRVQDDGVGLTPETALRNTSRQGLNNVASRLQLLGGTLQLARAQPRGTQVVLTIPLQPAEVGILGRGDHGDPYPAGR